MVMVSLNFFEVISNYYKSFILLFPPTVQSFANFLAFVMLVVLYSVFVWNLYRFISKKNPLGLNLSQYNKFEDSLFSRVFTGLLYFVEYILILPFLITFIFAIFALFLIVLSKSTEISQVIIVSAIVIAAVRVTAYYKEDLSREISKMLPFTLLAISVLNPYYFTDKQFVEKILANLSQIPLLFREIAYYILFIIILEVVLLFFDFIFSFFKTEEDSVIEGE